MNRVRMSEVWATGRVEEGRGGMRRSSGWAALGEVVGGEHRSDDVEAGVKGGEEQHQQHKRLCAPSPQGDHIEKDKEEGDARRHSRQPPHLTHASGLRLERRTLHLSSERPRLLSDWTASDARDARCSAACV